MDDIGVRCPNCGYVHHFVAELMATPCKDGWRCYRCREWFAAEIEITLKLEAAKKPG